jgi:pimeloyl-ACP methyl ester carboxylesterase
MAGASSPPSSTAPPRLRAPVSFPEVPTSAPVDGFRLAYERVSPSPPAPPVVLLHGWPGDRTDYEALVPLLVDRAEVIVPDLRGFGASDKHPEPPADAYSAVAQARSVVGLIEELGLVAPVIAGYDVGSRIAQAIARDTPHAVKALVVSPPLPGAGERVLAPEAQREFWYQSFHQLPLVEQVLDGDAGAVRAYLAHFWRHWSGPTFELTDARLDHLAEVYGAPGAMAASVGWYRAGSGMVASSLAEPADPTPLTTPTTVLWQSDDPLFPRAWADRLGRFFSSVELRPLDGVGHFTPLEAPQAFADAIDDFLGLRSS